MIPEVELEHKVIREVEMIKSRYEEWGQPMQLAQRLGVRVEFNSLGGSIDGATFDDLIVMDPTVGFPPRFYFTFYHEIVHQIIRRHDELYSSLHDQYYQEADLTRILERLANVGAAEFLIPRSSVLEAVRSLGFSMELLQRFHDPTRVSLTAVSVQLGLSAPHRCISVVARRRESDDQSSQSTLLSGPRSQTLVDVATSSRSMKYMIAKGTPVAADHLLSKAMNSEPGTIIKDRSPIPFRNTPKAWPVDCEALRIGSQVFALFHVDTAPSSSKGQLLFDY